MTCLLFGLTNVQLLHKIKMKDTDTTTTANTYLIFALETGKPNTELQIY